MQLCGNNSIRLAVMLATVFASVVPVFGNDLIEPIPSPTTSEQSELELLIPIQGPAFVLDLETAWRLAGVDNPDINRAKAFAAEADALQRRAKLVWIPHLTGGVNFRYHSGVYQSSFGQIRDVTMKSAYVGAGGNVVGGNPPAVPGIRLFTSLADAFYDPLAARQMTLERRCDATATRNSVLLQTTVAYLELMAAEMKLEALQQSYDEIKQVLDTTAAYAKTGQGRAGDAHRAEAEGYLIVADFRRLEEDLHVRSAELARRLHLEPTTFLQTPGGALETFDLVDLRQPLVQLNHIAERCRPEMSARAASISQSQTRVRQEKARPWLPMIMAGYSAGGFGGTGNFTPAVAPFDSLQPRTDFDLWAFWTLRNAGMGNLAAADQRRAEVERRVGERDVTRNQIRVEVSEAFATAVARRRQLSPTIRRAQDAAAGFTADYHRLRGGEGLPLESLNSLRQSVTARQELINVVVSDTTAQFRLFVALGRPPYCIVPTNRELQLEPTSADMPTRGDLEP